MCARFELKSRNPDIVSRFDLENAPMLLNSPDVRPTDQALIIGPSGASRLMAWGFEVTWDNTPLINARAETLTKKKTFRDVLDNRCLIPASAYFEWRSNGTQKLKNRIAPEDQDIFAMAGLTDGKRFTIITCAPAPSVENIHNRMPVILNPASEAAWLGPNIAIGALKNLLIPYSSAPMVTHEDTPPPPRQKYLFD